MMLTSRFTSGFPLLLSAACLVASACNDGGVMADGGTGIGSLEGGQTTGTGMDTGTSTTDAADSSGGPAGPCENGTRDGEETDVDCGGGSCDPCGPGGRCESNDDCDTMICAGGFCQTPTCYDGLLNGSETGVDCGGSCPNSCTSNGCINNAQCGSGQFCLDGECAPSSCENEIQDTLESDVDCGGPQCPDCGPGGSCNVNADCTSHICSGGICAVPACNDGIENGDETDADCGGSCAPCSNGDSCSDGSDCVNGVCSGGTCIAASCIDMIENGNETDVDCGGPQCNDCPDGSSCNSGADCINAVCMGGVCLGPLCNDGAQNGDETDIDCGNSCGATCVTGQDCDSSGDCVQGVCEFGQCSAPDCNDGVDNGNETDVDCGGSCGATCTPGEGCNLGSDCVQGVCNGGMCSVPACNDGVDNGNETDVDCGGSCGATCMPGNTCGNGGDCTQGVCILGVCQAPSCSDGVANGIEEGVDCAGNCAQPCPVGNEVLVNTTLPDFQVSPVVAASPDGNYFVVVWASWPVANPPQDGNGAGVYARVYNALGVPVTNEVLVNVTTMGNQSFPAVDAINNSFVVAWQGPDGSGNGVFARRFSSAGVPIGGEIVVAAAPADEQRRPDIAITPAGAFVVCWEDQPVSVDILCRRFNAGGAPIAGEQLVHNANAANQNLPVVEVADSGEWTVVWQSNSQDGDGVGVFMRRFTAAGAPIGAGEVQVNQYTALNQQGPAIGMNALGAYVLSWSSDNQDGSSTGVYARRYSAAGVAQGNEFQVNTTTAGAQNNPVVALNADGDFVIAWQTADDGVLTGVFAQRYNQAGVAFNTEFLVNPTVSGLQEEPDVAIRGANEIVGVWSDGDVGFTNRDIRMQRYAGQFP